MTPDASVHTGACLCGRVAFAALGPLRPILLCHCTQCRRWSGHAWAATSVPLDRFRLIRADSLVWFRSSARAHRGFCGTCGARMFWQPDDEGRISLAAGALDGDAGLTVAAEWHTEDAGDYYGAPPQGAEPAPAQVARLEGRCLCGANQFALPGPMGAVTGCHCAQCRRTSGHFAASFDVPEDALDWASRDWTEYRTSGGATRAFCRGCGSALWFRAADGVFSVEAGCIDNPTGGWMAGHIHTATKAGWVTLDDGVARNTEGGLD